MKRFKVVIVVGTRPEIIRLSRVINCLDNNCELILVHTGQNYDYELNAIFFEDLEVRKPNYFLDCAGINGTETIANILSKIDPVFAKEIPDAVLVLGDTNSALSVIAAKKRKIPVFHMEAGNRCFDDRVPEEVNRRIVDHIADINLPYSDIAREYLLREGIAPDRVVKTGSPMAEVLRHFRDNIDASSILVKLDLKSENYFLVSTHREENIDPEAQFLTILESLNNIASKYNKPVVVSTHPRTRSRVENSKKNMHSNIRFLKPLGFFDYNKLQINSDVTISDSGTITEESSILGFPAVNLRESHERPEGMEEGTVIMTGLKIDNIMRAIDLEHRRKEGAVSRPAIVRDYDVDSVSDKILKILLSYTDFVNRNVWHKNIAF